jgi:hypothetical protein
MKRLVQFLAILLVLQLMLVFGVNQIQPSLSVPPPQTLLITPGDVEINQLTIEDTDGKELSLHKSDGFWIIPIDNNFPADQEKVETFLEKLLALERGLPIGTTPQSLERFMVEKDNFERRIALYSDEMLVAEIFLGTSPRARMAHGRTNQDTSVFEIKIATYEAPVESKEWQNAKVVQIPYLDIDAIALPGLINLVRNRPPDSDTPTDADTAPNEELWSSPELGPGESIHQESADTLAKKISVLRFIDVLGTDMKEAYQLTPPKLTLVIETINDATVVYEIGTIDGGNDYVLKASTRPEYFLVPNYLVESLIEAVDRDAIVRK